VREIFVGELDPIRPNLALELHPIDLNLIPVHRCLLVGAGRATPRPFGQHADDNPPMRLQFDNIGVIRRKNLVWMGGENEKNVNTCACALLDGRRMLAEDKSWRLPFHLSMWTA
jgi:hypothetical protein